MGPIRKEKKKALSSMFTCQFYWLLLEVPRDGAGTPSLCGAVPQSLSSDCQQRVFIAECYFALKSNYTTAHLLISHTYSLCIRTASIYFYDSNTLPLFLFLLPLQNKYHSEATRWLLLPLLHGQ